MGRTATVTVDGHQLAYRQFGSGDRVVVLSHAFLTSHYLEHAWAKELAEHGFRVICLDVLGTTVDGHPLESDRYTSEALGRQLIGALDALGVERAVLGGTSIGANISVEAAALAPERVAGLLLEGPFLERGIGAAGYLWSAGLTLFTLGRPLVWLAGAVARSFPEPEEPTLGLLREFLTAPPTRSAAFMRGMLVGRMAPPRAVRRAVSAPTMILSLSADPLHPAADAHNLAVDIDGAQVISVGTLATLRFWPRKVTPAIVSFLVETFGIDVTARQADA
ncbi:alpha/beta hydrolase [Mycobacterium sp. CBMA271]|uniref:alpha/beta fold hydrolase n=1 Tax=unclassified Mycobacteroides TaxID=2618759 RepID=UPI001329F6C3|nr:MULTISPECIES: alpha/beta hydrolase [unclassified Mycobacteroides]MUM16022.1 alpha/beta hydrolase [Mycobacteroides sp. CBMA 326]MUM22479.1 alpha/beta hydrolase [Mycobacteroides sp. CBMA 271]